MLRSFDRPETGRILSFLREIGIAVAVEPLPDSFLPGLAVREGGLVVDPERLKWPGDLLHEAGHIAVTEPARRPALSAVPDDPGEGMAPSPGPGRRRRRSGWRPKSCSTRITAPAAAA